VGGGGGRGSAAMGEEKEGREEGKKGERKDF
jgi:hypothetical protein